ncbi:flavin reductase family protein [Algoriphagus sediminis]|uniref:Flavin reductase family protein n=1 Tax=Algoriphagus sediminis TaxID=3057113 RepID=A0ABT7Y966_9BACT|nr:flavin reductase family protein [Algoriphagus sediminis]MDN3203060.1 flavin reductase family protein [Algoriphagus sediminis]
MKTFYPGELKTSEFHALLQGSVAPRPIAFASTIDKEGNVNLSPFSFFNLFSTNPPIVIFSPSRRVRDNTTKHTLENVLEVPETVIHVVNFDLVEQMSLASTEYEKGVNEFVKAGLTSVPSEKVKPPRVKEAPIAMECRVNEVKALGDQGGSGNLVICEVLALHVSEDVMDSAGAIDPNKLDAVARLGGAWYSRASGDSLFQIPKPLRTKGIGVDQLPESVRISPVLTGNNLGRLANVEELPSEEEVNELSHHPAILDIKRRFVNDPESFQNHLHELAKEYLEKGDVETAWRVLMQ